MPVRPTRSRLRWVAALLAVPLLATAGATLVAPSAYASTAPTITVSNQVAVVGTAFSYTPTVTGSPAPNVGVAPTSPDQLPAGLTLSGGVISGTPSAGTGRIYHIKLRAQNSAGNDTANWQLTVGEAVSITGTSTATATVGTAFTYTPTVLGFPKPTVTRVPAGDALPDGLSLDESTGVISGTPAVGSGRVYHLGLRAKNSVSGPTGTSTLMVTLTVNEAAGITGASAATGQANHSFDYTPAVTGYPASTVALDASSVALPAGLTLNSTTGEISGTPALTSYGGSPYTIVLKATNGIGSGATLVVKITINKDDVTGLAPSISGLAQVGQTLTAHAGTIVPGSAVLTYVWKANGNPIPGATSSTFTLTNAQVGKNITVTITATADPDYNAETLTSSATDYVREFHAVPVVTPTSASVPQGSSVTLFFQGLQPGSTYTVTTGRNQVLATGTADVYGELVLNVDIPASTPVGTQTLTVSGAGSSSVLSIQVQVTRGSRR